MDKDISHNSRRSPILKLRAGYSNRIVGERMASNTVAVVCVSFHLAGPMQKIGHMRKRSDLQVKEVETTGSRL